jgi:dolichol-phosphate mannosyltransferase
LVHANVERIPEIEERPHVVPLSPVAEPAKKLRAVLGVCSFNNGKNVERVLANIPAEHERDYDVVVINDGSTDDTPSYIAKFNFPVVTHPYNRGAGGAIKSAISYARDNKYDVVCVLAGNDKDDPREAGKLIDMVRNGDADYVQGSRFAAGGTHENTPAFRHVMVKVHATMFRVLTGYSGTDALNGFRAYRTSLFDDPKIDVFQDWLDKYELETYLHYKVLKGGYRIAEVGVSKTYPPKKGRGKYSHIRPVLDWWKILRPLPMLILGIKK